MTLIPSFRFTNEQLNPLSKKTPGEPTVTETTESDSTKEAYDKAYAEAVEKLYAYLKENAPRKVDNPNQAFSVTQEFTVNGQKYFITAKPTYYKGPDNMYYLYDPRVMGSSRFADMHIDYSVEEVPENRVLNGMRNVGDVNVDNYGDQPSSWVIEVGSEVVDLDNGDKLRRPVFRYDYSILNKHLPSDIIEQFFEQDPEYPNGYKLKDNCKKIELVDDNKYRITYTDENGKERQMTFTIGCSTTGNGIAAMDVSDVDVEEDNKQREEREKRLKEITNNLRGQLGIRYSLVNYTNL